MALRSNSTLHLVIFCCNHINTWLRHVFVSGTIFVWSLRQIVENRSKLSCSELITFDRPPPILQKVSFCTAQIEQSMTHSIVDWRLMVPYLYFWITATHSVIGCNSFDWLAPDFRVAVIGHIGYQHCMCGLSMSQSVTTDDVMIDYIMTCKRFLYYIAAELWCSFLVSLNTLLNKQQNCPWFETPWLSCDVTVKAPNYSKLVYGVY